MNLEASVYGWCIGVQSGLKMSLFLGQAKWQTPSIGHRPIALLFESWLFRLPNSIYPLLHRLQDLVWCHRLCLNHCSTRLKGLKKRCWMSPWICAEGEAGKDWRLDFVRMIAMRAGHGQWSRARATAVRRDCLCISDSMDEPARFRFRTAALLYCLSGGPSAARANHGSEGEHWCREGESGWNWSLKVPSNSHLSCSFNFSRTRTLSSASPSLSSSTTLPMLQSSSSTVRPLRLPIKQREGSGSF